MDTSLEIDAIGLLCPLPVLRLRKRIAALPAGALVRILADDPAAVIDIPHFCAESGNEFVSLAPIAAPTPATAPGDPAKSPHEFLIRIG